MYELNNVAPLKTPLMFVTFEVSHSFNLLTVDKELQNEKNSVKLVVFVVSKTSETPVSDRFVHPVK
jgi:hypothetical protein